MKFLRSEIVPHGTLTVAMLPLLSALILPLAAEELRGDVAALPQVPQLVVMATEEEAAHLSVQSAVLDMLLGWDESARLHFRAALAADPNCGLAWCGLMLTEGPTAESRDALQQWMMSEAADAATPAEMQLMTTWLRWVQGGRSGAGEEFAERAAQFRADWLSACWAIVLLHDGYDSSGKPLPAQQRVLKLAEGLYSRLPDNPVVAYLRAWVEEVAPVISDEALQAAERAVVALPEHPSPRLLLGHLLFRRGQFKEAILCFHEAAGRAGVARKIVPHGTVEQDSDGCYPLELWPLEIRAKLYESTALWLDGRERDSLMVQSELLKRAASVDNRYREAPGAVLLHWEARSLPLRLLMLRKKMPSDAQVAAASKAAIPTVPEKGEPVLELRDCLRFCVVARQRAAAGKEKQALRCLEAAEACFKRLAEAEERCKGQGEYQLSAWARAHEACRLALYAAKAAVYPDTAEIWLRSLEEAKRPATMLMPPVLPQS